MEIAVLSALHCRVDRSELCFADGPLTRQGYMGTPYIEKLSTELENRNWSLCQLHMRSSYLGFGTGSLNRDFEDISECISYLHAAGKSHVVLMGHSTGSQNTIHYVLNRLSNQKSSSSPCGVIVFQTLDTG